MLMKKVILLVFFLLSSFQFYAKKNCECGTHATGITTWSVEGEDCCTSTANPGGMQYTYYEQHPGIWVVNSTTPVTGSSAQNSCCNNPVT